MMDTVSAIYAEPMVTATQEYYSGNDEVFISTTTWVEYNAYGQPISTFETQSMTVVSGGEIAQI